MSPIKNKFFLGISAIVTVVGLFGVAPLLNRPPHLGEELEYIGKNHSSGCFLVYCDSPPSTTYFFATNLTVEELKTYFKKAINVDQKKLEYPATSRGDEHIELGYKLNDEQGFTLYAYQDKMAIAKNKNLKSPSSPAIVRIDSSVYEIAKE